MQDPFCWLGSRGKCLQLAQSWTISFVAFKVSWLTWIQRRFMLYVCLSCLVYGSSGVWIFPLPSVEMMYVAMKFIWEHVSGELELIALSNFSLATWSVLWYNFSSCLLSLLFPLDFNSLPFFLSSLCLASISLGLRAGVLFSLCGGGYWDTTSSCRFGSGSW